MLYGLYDIMENQMCMCTNIYYLYLMLFVEIKRFAGANTSKAHYDFAPKRDCMLQSF